MGFAVPRCLCRTQLFVQGVQAFHRQMFQSRSLQLVSGSLAEWRPHPQGIDPGAGSCQELFTWTWNASCAETRSFAIALLAVGSRQPVFAMAG